MDFSVKKSWADFWSLNSYSKCGEFRPLVLNQLKYSHLSLDFFFFFKGASLQEVDVKIEAMSRFDTV